MARIQLNPLMDKLRGQIGDLVIRRVGNQLVISASAERIKRPPIRRMWCSLFLTMPTTWWAPPRLRR